MGPIKADFDGILPPFDLWAPLRQILMAFCPFFAFGAQFDGIFPFCLKGFIFSKGPKGRDYILVSIRDTSTLEDMNLGLRKFSF